MLVSPLQHLPIQDQAPPLKQNLMVYVKLPKSVCFAYKGPCQWMWLLPWRVQRGMGLSCQASIQSVTTIDWTQTNLLVLLHISSKLLATCCPSWQHSVQQDTSQLHSSKVAEYPKDTQHNLIHFFTQGDMSKIFHMTTKLYKLMLADFWLMDCSTQVKLQQP